MADQRNPVDCFKELEKQIVSIPQSQIEILNIPLSEAMQEGRRVEALVDKHHDELLRSDIDPALLDSIGTRAGAFSYCITVFESQVNVEKNNMAKFQELKREGYALRKRISDTLSYIFRNDSNTLSVLDKIARGRGDLEMIRDLLSYYTICMEHRERLRTAYIDETMVDRLNTLYKELFSMAAMIDIDPEKESKGKLLCWQAWTFLWEAMSEIYAAGRYVFSQQPEIEELYYMDYRQEIAKKRLAPKTEEQEPAEIKDPAVVA